ncbi:hypothetical protein [Tumebacillus flagellatus]|uniref:hypothetical protein n=1 Tax=Tumebacillus flagellatus TaxID=1157490 RepID=UPI0013772FEA|nr:hypothetical protein [Tumebacillus flagellatus]
MEKKPKRRMRVRDKIIIFTVMAVGLAGAGFELFLNSKVDAWNIRTQQGKEK